LAARVYAGQVAFYAGQVASKLAERLPPADVTVQQLRERSWWTGPELYLVVDDYDLVSAGRQSPLAQLADYLPQAREAGFHVVVDPSPRYMGATSPPATEVHYAALPVRVGPNRRTLAVVVRTRQSAAGGDAWAHTRPGGYGRAGSLRKPSRGDTVMTPSSHSCGRRWALATARLACPVRAGCPVRVPVHVHWSGV